MLRIHGLTGSAGLQDSLKPSSTTREEPMSDRLLKASARMATLPDISPITNFMQNRKILQRIPTTQPRLP